MRMLVTINEYRKNSKVVDFIETGEDYGLDCRIVTPILNERTHLIIDGSKKNLMRLLESHSHLDLDYCLS